MLNSHRSPQPHALGRADVDEFTSIWLICGVRDVMHQQQEEGEASPFSLMHGLQVSSCNFTAEAGLDLSPRPFRRTQIPPSASTNNASFRNEWARAEQADPPAESSRASKGITSDPPHRLGRELTGRLLVAPGAAMNAVG